jgi:predicted RNA binding protein YcfA (HicA-like mRNA interferase family)
MPKTAFTYRDLDERLRALGFSVHTQKGRARIYRHEQRGASVILPDAPFGEEVLPHHLAVTRHALKEYDMADLETAKSLL